ncbi:Flagellar L-ring protein 2 [Beijerinckiaceae bacterium RH AL1]|nr:flagellar basal body L-ring protein FlgH [Beijerinckiaceae bacterium]VVB47927.1 Flagellar L-ring protein 2 [Beijerinckiaceae bacterium RH CH11]VVB48004.1 Flagellar L-ring protein 2 [Beijerinckiaceae bacterium RH AL8]VVC56134.1 Flagellar L-ring protein 2 [Beijerinckiaceae bacterium RH AL1]
MSARLTLVALASAGLALSGCAVRPTEIGREPTLTPVGAGIEPAVVPHHFAGDEVRPAFNSLYQDGASLYRDPRAMKAGDVITVLIAMNDKASLGNNTQASLDDEVANKFDLALGKGKITGDFNSSSTTGATGQGQIDRTEKIKVSVGAVVSEVLPNGNLVVSGSQEMRVNFEIRQVYFAGIVRPQDISKDNTIPYDKVSEARISYGGRGRLSEVQQPSWGQQIYNAVKPF